MGRKGSYSQLLEKIADNIRKNRLRHGFSQEQMAERGFNYRFYQKLESGKHSPNLQTLHKLSEVFKVSLHELLK